MNKRLAEIIDMPWIYLQPSLECNLNCSYCTQQFAIKDKTHHRQDGDMGTSELAKLVDHIPPTHFYITGGEPLVYPEIDELVTCLTGKGHLVSIDTNLVVNRSTLDAYLKSWDLSRIVHFNVSHHIHQVSLECILPAIELLQEYGVPSYVKFIAQPDLLFEIDQHCKTLRQKQIGISINPLIGLWDGKNYPCSYSDAEIDQLIDMFTMEYLGLLLFGGIVPRGISCRCGNDVIILRLFHKDPYIRCCHGEQRPITFDETFFGTNKKHTKGCELPQCQVFTFGFNGVHPETDRLDQICSGNSPPLGRTRMIEFLHDILEQGHELLNQSALEYHLQRWGKPTKRRRPVYDKTIKIPLRDAKPCVPGLEIKGRWNIRIKSIPLQWSYLCRYLFENYLIPEGPCRIEVTARVHRGYLGIGVLDSSQKLFIREVQVKPGKKTEKYYLDINKSSHMYSLIFRNWADNSYVTEATIKLIRVWF